MLRYQLIYRRRLMVELPMSGATVYRSYYRAMSCAKDLVNDGYCVCLITLIDNTLIDSLEVQP